MMSDPRATARTRARVGLWLVLMGVFAGLGAGCTSRQGAEPPLAYRQAEDAFRLGDYDRAARAYGVFLRSGERDDLVPAAYYRLALSQSRSGRGDEALETLNELERRYPKRKWVQVYELRGDIERARGNAISAVRWWELAWEIASGEQRNALGRRISDTLARMDTASLKAARSVLKTEQFQAYADARIRSGAAPAPPVEAAPEAPPTKTSVPSSMPIPAEKLRIGCLLPLSGRYAPYGQRSLNGIQMALGSEASRLVVRDTQGQPQIARAALDAFIADNQIAVVIGPLRSQIAEAVAPRAERSGLPLIVLSQRGGIGGNYVVQPSMTDRRQAATLAEFALRQRRLRRFAILHPSDSYGTTLSEAFRAEVQRRQGEIVGALVYGSGAEEFSAEVLSVRKWVDDKGLEAVFIPDSAATAVQLAGDLRRAEPGLTLLGGNGWYDPAELGRAGGAIDGAVFVNGFFAASGRPATRAFVAAYQEAYQSSPEILEAQAYDAATLVKRALAAGARSRGDFLGAMRSAGPFEGAAGDVRFGADGLERDLFLLEVRGGAVREVGNSFAPAEEPAPTSRPVALPVQ